MVKNDNILLTGIGAQPHRNRIFIQFDYAQYCIDNMSNSLDQNMTLSYSTSHLGTDAFDN